MGEDTKAWPARSAKVQGKAQSPQGEEAAAEEAARKAVVAEMSEFINIAVDPEEGEGPVKMSSRYGKGEGDGAPNKAEALKRKGSILGHAQSLTKGLSDLTSGKKEEITAPLTTFVAPSKDPHQYQTLTEGRLGFIIVFD